MSVTQPELFPFKLLLGWWERREERTGGGIESLVRFDVQVLWVPSWYPQDSAASPGLMCAIAGSLCSVQPSTRCIDLPCFSLICPVCSALSAELYHSYSRLVGAIWCILISPFTSLTLRCCHFIHAPANEQRLNEQMSMNEHTSTSMLAIVMSFCR